MQKREINLSGLYGLASLPDQAAYYWTRHVIMDWLHLTRFVGPYLKMVAMQVYRYVKKILMLIVHMWNKNDHNYHSVHYIFSS